MNGWMDGWMLGKDERGAPSRLWLQRRTGKGRPPLRRQLRELDNQIDKLINAQQENQRALRNNWARDTTNCQTRIQLDQEIADKLQGLMQQRANIDN